MTLKYVKKNNAFELIVSNKNEFTARINPQCSFKALNNKKLLTSNNGKIYKFDEVHLSKAGARKLSSELILSKNSLKKIINFFNR